MKRVLPLCIGMTLLCQTLAPAYAEPLYDTVKKSMDAALRGDDVEEEVAAYVGAVSKEKKWEIVADDVKDILKGDKSVCDKYEKLKGTTLCAETFASVQALVQRENAIREAGRHMQSVATSYELPVSEIPRKSRTVIGDLGAVLNLWAATDRGQKKEEDETDGGGKIIVIPAADESVEGSEKEIEGSFRMIADHLNGMSKEERAAVVWHLRYGINQNGTLKTSIIGPKGNENLDADYLKDCEDSERRYLCDMPSEGDLDLENHLDNFLSAHLTGSLNDLLKASPIGDEDTVYFQFDDKAQALLPDGIIVWARWNKLKDPTEGQFDLGLDWEYPLEPVLPSLLTDQEKPILGGNYPPEPALLRTAVEEMKGKPDPLPYWMDGIGLCTMSMARNGYLCRPVTQSAEEGCPDPEDADKDSVTLVGCAVDEKEKTTVAGPDVCEDIGWKGEYGKADCSNFSGAIYSNTIGNNLCFIGECAETSLETHRVTGGRTPAGVQDMAYPYDNPLAGSPLGNFLSAPTGGQPVLPPYKPLEPVREFDAALCALVGLPAGMPAALCTVAADRRLDAPLGDAPSTVLDMTQMQEREALTADDTAMLAESVGMRMGTELYARNLRVMSKSLSEVLGTATQLFNEIASIDFPTEMCPMGMVPPESQ